MALWTVVFNHYTCMFVFFKWIPDVMGAVWVVWRCSLQDAAFHLPQIQAVMLEIFFFGLCCEWKLEPTNERDPLNFGLVLFCFIFSNAKFGTASMMQICITVLKHWLTSNELHLEENADAAEASSRL